MTVDAIRKELEATLGHPLAPWPPSCPVPPHDFEDAEPASPSSPTVEDRCRGCDWLRVWARSGGAQVLLGYYRPPREQ